MNNIDREQYSVLSAEGGHTPGSYQGRNAPLDGNGLSIWFSLTSSRKCANNKIPEKVKPAARRGRKATGLIEIAGLPGGWAIRFVVAEDMTMTRPTLPMKISARLLFFSCLEYLAHDPTSSLKQYRLGHTVIEQAHHQAGKATIP